MKCRRRWQRHICCCAYTRVLEGAEKRKARFLGKDKREASCEALKDNTPQAQLFQFFVTLLTE